MKPIAPNVSLLLGAALGVTLLLVSLTPPSSAATPQSASLLPSYWPPHPDTIVNLDSCNDPAGVGTEGCNITMSPSDEHTIFTVPANRHLVVTHWEARTNASGTDLLLQLLQQTTAGSTVMRGHDFNGRPSTGVGPTYSSSTGLVFEPGSKVILRRTSAGTTPVAANYTLTGYLRK